MTQEDKELLFKELCARLPYGVKVYDDMGRTYTLNIGNSYLIDLFYENGDYVDAPIKPYLRPMSSMNEEERREYELLANRCITNSVGFIHFDVQELINWLLKNHFDYNGLTPKGLAIEVTEENNLYKYKML